MTVWWMGVFAGVYELPGGLTESLRRDCSLKLDIFINQWLCMKKIKIMEPKNGTCSIL